MKKTGSETPAEDSEKSKAAQAEPMERTRLQADVAKQRVRIAKEELKRARKRLKEAKREARRARKQAATARKAWKQERRAAQAPAKAKSTSASEKKKKAVPKAEKKATRKPKPVAAGKRKAAAPVSKMRPARSNATQPPARASVRRTKGPRVKRSAVRPEKPSVGTTTTASVVPVTPAANAEEITTLDGASSNGAAAEHGT